MKIKITVLERRYWERNIIETDVDNYLKEIYKKSLGVDICDLTDDEIDDWIFSRGAIDTDEHGGLYCEIYENKDYLESDEYTEPLFEFSIKSDD